MNKLLDIGSRVRSWLCLVKPRAEACCAQPSMKKNFVPRSRSLRRDCCLHVASCGLVWQPCAPCKPPFYSRFLRLRPFVCLSNISNLLFMIYFSNIDSSVQFFIGGLYPPAVRKSAHLSRTPRAPFRFRVCNLFSLMFN